MDKQNIIELLVELGVRKNKIQEVSGWMSCGCPLAPYTHERGTDSSPSFGIKINPDGESFFNCFTCKEKGPVKRLLKLLSKFSGEDYTDLISTVFEEEVIGGDLPEWGTKQRDAKPRLGEPLDENYILLYDEAGDHPYLRERGVTPAVVEEFGVLYDSDNRGAERIVIPVRDPQGHLFGFFGRAISPDVVPRVRDYHGLPKRLLLLGLDRCAARGVRDLILVEGPFDCLRLWSLGYYAVAAMHSDITEAQALLLREYADTVCIMFDNDQAGRIGRKKAAKKLKEFMPVTKVAYPKGYKDPGELEARHVKRMMEHRRLV